MKRIGRQRWLESPTDKIEDVVRLAGIKDFVIPSGKVLVGWLWLNGDGSYGLIRVGERTGHRSSPPVALHPLLVDGYENTDTSRAGDTRLH